MSKTRAGDTEPRLRQCRVRSRKKAWKNVCARSVTQPCLTLCDLTDCNPPASSIHGISKERILEWVAISSSRRSSWHRDRTHVSWISCISKQILTTSIIWEPYSTLLCVKSDTDNAWTNRCWCIPITLFFYRYKWWSSLGLWTVIFQLLITERKHTKLYTIQHLKQNFGTKRSKIFL